MDTRFLRIFFATAYVFPAILSIVCHQDYEGMNASSPAFCSGSLCAIVYFSFTRQIQSCIYNVGIITGCIGNSDSKILCTCDTDRCNSNSYRIKRPISPNGLFVQEISCPGQKGTGKCDNPTCMLTNDTSRLYPNAVFINRSSQFELDNHNNSVLVPTVSKVAYCTRKDCEKNYNETGKSRNYGFVSCYTSSDDNLNASPICTGHLCYTNYFNGTTTRGCLDHVFDSLWSQGETEYLLDDKRAEKFSIQQFLLLEYYFCNYNYCNTDSVRVKRNNANCIIGFANIAIIAASVITRKS